MSDVVGSRCEIHKPVLRPDVPGARFWAVPLDKVMLTYFEVDAQCRWPGHAHESEQITLVLDGILYFETRGGVTVVKPGEVFAVLANTWHAVFTRGEPARAVDAWSPVRQEFVRTEEAPPARAARGEDDKPY